MERARDMLRSPSMTHPGARIVVHPEEAEAKASKLSPLKKHWFLIGIFVVITLANMAPYVGAKGGPLVPEITIKYIAVSFIFFNSGLSLPSDQLHKAIFNVRAHAFIQLFTMVGIPIAIRFLVYLLGATSLLDPALLSGLMVLACMPPPVSSAVIVTKAAGGNEALAIFNSALGSFLGIFATPSLILFFLGTTAEVPFGSIIGTLMMTVVVPLLVGQLVRVRYWTRVIEPMGIPFSTLSGLMLLLIIYAAFCDTFSHESSLPATQLLTIVFIDSFLILSFTAIAFVISFRLLAFPRPDVVAAMFCSSHKSLTLGMPILSIIYSGRPELSLLSIPLLMYHPLQILIHGIMVPFVRPFLAASPLLPLTTVSPV